MLTLFVSLFGVIILLHGEPVVKYTSVLGTSKLSNHITFWPQGLLLKLQNF